MNILIIGAGGMLGSKLVAELVLTKSLLGQCIAKVIRHDIVLSPPPPKADFAIETQMGDLSIASEAVKLIAARPDVIFHLAAIVSGEAEANFELGYSINFDGTRNLLEAIRKQGDGYKPKLIFTSSIAVFGAPFEGVIADDFFATPLTSYGTQKAMGELLLADYSRRGFVDGLALRMPTICVRPGKPNKAASGFFSNIIREPLAGREAVLPVEDSVRHWHASPRSAVAMLIHAAQLDTSAVGARRTLTMPGLSCTVAEQIAAMVDVAGADVAALIKRVPDETITKIVSGWPQNFNPVRALALGFKADKSFADIIRVHITDEMQGKTPWTTQG